MASLRCFVCLFGDFNYFLLFFEVTHACSTHSEVVIKRFVFKRSSPLSSPYPSRKPHFHPFLATPSGCHYYNILVVTEYYC